MFRISTILLIVFWSSWTWAGACSPASGTKVYSYNAGNHVVTNPDQDKAGTTFPNVYYWDTYDAGYNDYCSCSGTFGASYFTTRTSLPAGHSDGYHRYYKVNDNLEVTADVFIAGAVNDYIPIPLDHTSNYNSGGSNSCSGIVNYGTGSKGRLSLYISKPFLGNVSFSATVFDLYITTGPYDSIGSTSSARVIISGSVTVPQNCTINAGQTITVDFGTMMSSSFKTAGEKPTGMTDKTFNVPIKCASMDGTANLTLRVNATPASGNANAIASNNPDVGVVVTSEQGTVLKPNNSSSEVPFNVDNSGNATVTLKSYPISTTGKQPKEGAFSALATLVIDFA